MTLKPYERDVWTLGPNNTGYPGAFPNGFVKRLKRKGWWGSERLWMFSGSFKDPRGTTVDIKPECNPTVVANCEQLPFADERFDFVCLDPPYSEAEAAALYNLPMCNMAKVMNEAARVCKPGGTVVLLHRLIPWYAPWENDHKKRLAPQAIIGVFTIAGYTNMRALSVWRKQETLKDYEAWSQLTDAAASGGEA
jgi:SAM-dependent methyltransferase